MARRNKFIKGPAITDPVLVCTMILDGQWLYERERLLSPRYFEIFTLGRIRNLALAGDIYIALPNKESTP